jgi:hypothetical protein
MGTTIHAPESPPIERVLPPIVQVRRSWTAKDAWITVPELEVDHVAVQSAGHGNSSCTLRRRYGLLKLPWETAIAEQTAGWWVKITLVSQAGRQTEWIGRIFGEGRDLHGAAAHGPSGVQHFQVYGLLQLLERVPIERSHWQDVAGPIAWVPRFNDRLGDGTFLGNRTALKTGGVYLFGGEDTWTSAEAIEYLLHHFANHGPGLPNEAPAWELQTGKPAWKLDGDKEVLDYLSSMPAPAADLEGRTLAEALRLLVPLSDNLDFLVEPDPKDAEGILVRVFSLMAEEFRFGDVGLPANRRRAAIAVGKTVQSLGTHIAVTEDHAYKRLVVRGGRIVSCFSLHAEVAVDVFGRGKLIGGAPSLDRGWTDVMEEDYFEPFGFGLPAPDWAAGALVVWKDQVRREERFRDVYQVFAAPKSWTMVAWGGDVLPRFQADGTLDLNPPIDAGRLPWQNQVRRTLDWLPLLGQTDYFVRPPESNALPGIEREKLPPLAWIGWAHHDPETAVTDVRYQRAEQAGLAVRPLANDWGVRLQGPGLPHVIGGIPVETIDSEHPVRYDWRYLVLTIAAELDARLELVLQDPSWTPADGTKVVDRPDAQCWYLAPGTIFGTDPRGRLRDTGNPGQLLRCDTETLWAEAAATIARYQRGRCRAVLRFEGLQPFAPMVGQILEVLAEGDKRHRIQAPITAVEYALGDSVPETTVRAGFPL